MALTTRFSSYIWWFPHYIAAKAGDRVLAALVVIYDSALFGPPEDNVMKGSWSIESRLAGHRILLYRTKK